MELVDRDVASKLARSLRGEIVGFRRGSGVVSVDALLDNELVPVETLSDICVVPAETLPDVGAFFAEVTALMDVDPAAADVIFTLFEVEFTRPGVDVVGVAEFFILELATGILDEERLEFILIDSSLLLFELSAIFALSP